VVVVSFFMVGIAENAFVYYKGIQIWSAVWFQFLVPFSHANIIYGLSMDEGRSRTSIILSSRIWVFFGKISYALYLIH